MLLLRYVDDVVEVIKKENIESFTNFINDQDPKIQFTVETQGEDSEGQHLPVLDVDIRRNNDGTSDFRVYRKATHTDHYLNINSHHPLHQKLGIIRTLFDRAKTLITDPDQLIIEINNIKVALRNCGYPDWTFKKIEKQQEKQ